MGRGGVGVCPPTHEALALVAEVAAARYAGPPALLVDASTPPAAAAAAVAAWNDVSPPGGAAPWLFLLHARACGLGTSLAVL
ncbi:hypothetical protein APUTEX25_002372, partial [Auxenochlorella protothecoides]